MYGMTHMILSLSVVGALCSDSLVLYTPPHLPISFTVTYNFFVGGTSQQQNIDV